MLAFLHAGIIFSLPIYHFHKQMMRLSGMDSMRKAELKAKYKDMAFQAGVFQIRNIDSGKIYLGSSADINSIFNRFQTELKLGGCRIKQLQADWKGLGAEKFAFEVLDVIEPPKGEREVSRDDLVELEKLWLEKMKPWDGRGYNRKPKE
jgi:hypothetical protein